MSENIFLKDITLPITETGEDETYYFVQTDSDLNTAGAAADAKKVGDELTDLKGDISQFDGAVVDIANEKIGVKALAEISGYTWTAKQGVEASTGTVYTSTNFKRTSFIPCSGLNAIVVDMPIYKTTGGVASTYGIAFYSSSNNSSYISGVAMKLATGGNTAERLEIPVPEGANYFKTTWYDDSYSDYVYDETFLVEYYTDKWAVMEDDVAITETLGNDELCEYATVRSTDGVYEYTSTLFSVTSMIPVKSGTKITTKMAVGTFASQTHGIAFYDANKQYVSGIAPNTGDRGSETRTIDVPASARYFAIAYWNKANRELYGNFSCTYIMPDECTNKKRAYQSGYIFFSQSVNQSVNEYWNDTAETEQAYSPDLTTGVIALPAEYTPTGKPVPIIMYFHGYSHYVYMNHWGATEDFRTQKQHFIDAGFAVMDCNGGRNNNKTGYYTSGGSRQYVDGYKKCYEYIKEHYNVEDRCYIAGGSAGGIAAINYCFWFDDVKALMLLSAWSDLRTCSWEQGVTDTIIEYLGMVSGTYDASKAVGFDPAARILTIDNAEYLPTLKVQTKALVGSTESSHALYTALYRFINALRNAGQTATIREINGATHAEVVSGGVEFIDNEIINWFKSI